MKKNKYILITILILTIISFFNVNFANNQPNIIKEKAEVLEVDNIDNKSVNSMQKVKLEILTGEYKGKIFIVENNLPKNLAFQVKVEPNDKIIVQIEDNAEKLNVYISDHYRLTPIKILTLLFILLLIITGKLKGLKSVITISLTLILIYKVLIPGILNGMNPLLLTTFITSIITIITIFIISGLNFKSISAIIGTIFGVTIAAIISIIVGKLIPITGMMPDEIGMLMYLKEDINFNINHLLFSGIILGALGAVMDVGMSIASSTYEIYLANPKASFNRLFKSGMAVGRDIMGTMSNTLILAYTGSSIPLILLLRAKSNTQLKYLINMDIVATEIIRSLAGSIGLILTIPLTAFITSTLLKKVK
ncbi:MAG: YibE/F family protein [Bacillota bacterium]